jgi:hypothetical protein
MMIDKRKLTNKMILIDFKFESINIWLSNQNSNSNILVFQFKYSCFAKFIKSEINISYSTQKLTGLPFQVQFATSVLEWHTLVLVWHFLVEKYEAQLLDY